MPHVRVGEGADLKSVGLKGLARSNRVCGANVKDYFNFKSVKISNLIFIKIYIIIYM